MGIKSALSKPFAKNVVKKQQKWKANPIDFQKYTFKYLIQKGQQTQFGKDHNFDQIKSYDDFKKNVPIYDYEGLKPYIEKVVKGKEDILWPGLPKYFAKTSGTTSGAKMIPITKESIPNHVNGAKLALLHYIAETGNASFVDGKMIFLQGSPELKKKNGILTGRLSGIAAHFVPKYLQRNRLPSWETNCIEDWEKKLDQIIEETKNEKMSLISGIPSWVQMYYERLIEKTGKSDIQSIFPEFSLFVYGGVNFEPYRDYFNQLVGKKIPSIETYPASEGFIAFQDTQKEEGLLLMVNSGIFFEFIPVETYGTKDQKRLSIEEVELDQNYAVIINSNAGLWGYDLGDTVKFVSKNPHRIKVTGRIKHYISAFGEHVIAEEVENAIVAAVHKYGGQVKEFTVAPMVTPKEGLPYHEWLIQFSEYPNDVNAFSKFLDQQMVKQNIYYKDLIEGQILQPLQITTINADGFNAYMESQGKLGGQNKIPKLTNDRKIADFLMQFKA